jgi:hypothetical protein
MGLGFVRVILDRVLQSLIRFNGLVLQHMAKKLMMR